MQKSIWTTVLLPLKPVFRIIDAASPSEASLATFKLMLRPLWGLSLQNGPVAV